MACECSTRFNVKVVKQLAPFLPPACWLAPRWAVWNQRHGADDLGAVDRQEPIKGLSECTNHSKAPWLRFYANINVDCWSEEGDSLLNRR